MKLIMINNPEIIVKIKIAIQKYIDSDVGEKYYNYQLDCLLKKFREDYNNTTKKWYYKILRWIKPEWKTWERYVKNHYYYNWYCTLCNNWTKEKFQTAKDILNSNSTCIKISEDLLQKIGYAKFIS